MTSSDSSRGGKNTWVLPHHRIALRLGGWAVSCFTRLVCHARVTRYKDSSPSLILYNHQTPYDQFLVMMAFHQPVYHLASEDIFSNGWTSSVIRYFCNPIPIKKQTTDLNAIKTMLKVVKEGGTIALAPEGNRTYSGKTEYMSSGIVRLARKMRLPILLFRIEGGYGVIPRWSDRTRRGPMRAGVSCVITPEEYAQMSDDELFLRIKDGLYVNEARADARYVSRRKAEYLERAVYVCPFCGLSSFRSRGDEIECQTCRRKILYGEDKRLTGQGFSFPFAFVNDWYEYQNSFIRGLDVTAFCDRPMYTDTVRMSEVIPCERKDLLRSCAQMSLYGNRVVIDEGKADALCLSFDEVSAAAVLGRNKLNLYHNGKIYQFKGEKSFNALKYVNIYYRCQHQKRRDEDGQFLGL